MTDGALHEATEGPSRIARVRDSFHAWKLGTLTGLLLFLVTPMWLSFVPRVSGTTWIVMTVVAYALEVVSLVAIGRWARRVDHPEISPWSARLALALVYTMVPLAVLCGVSWWRTGAKIWAGGAAIVALYMTVHFGSIVDRLRRGK